jgi:hypothetical protein
MNRLTRNILLVTLCTASALPLCLSAFFLGGRILIRKTMLEKLETAETVVIRLPANGLHWYEKDHELLIDGRMFDVKSIRSIPGGYEVAGIFDDDETELFDLLKKTESGKQQGQGQLAGLFQSCLGIISDMPVSGMHFRIPWLPAALDFHPGPSVPVLHAVQLVETPPPDAVS